MNYQYTSDLLSDVLFRGGEPTSGASDFHSQTLTWINRAYRLVYDAREDWYWLRKEGTITLQPARTTGTVSVTQNSTAITFSSAPASSLTGWHFKLNNETDVYKISAHTAAAAGATLDGGITSATNGTATYTAFKLDYAVPADFKNFIAPLSSMRAGSYEINFIPDQEFTRTYPLNYIDAGVPTEVTLINATTFRFNRYMSTEYVRIDLDYQYVPADLVNGLNEEPVVPLRQRHIIADFALAQLLDAKDDQRAEGIRQLAVANLIEFSKKDKYQQRVSNAYAYRILPRRYFNDQRYLPRASYIPTV